MNRLLERQLRRQFGSLEAVPSGLKPLLEAIDASYEEAEQDRRLLERSLELTSGELMERNADLRRQVTELERTQRALEASEARHRLIVETATEGILLLDEHGHAAYANRPLADMVGLPLEEIQGRKLEHFLHPEESPEALAPLWDRGSLHALDVRLKRSDGAEAWAMVSGASLDAGAAKGTLVMFTDVTARRRAEEALRGAYRELKEQDRFRTQFLNNTAHELATPLTPMILQAEVLRRALGPRSPARDQVLLIERNIRRLAQLVNDVLDSSRLQSGRLQLRPESVDLVALLRETAGSFHESLARANLRLEKQLPSEVWVRVDPKRVTQVVFNLLSNALKFTPAGGRVALRCVVVGHQAQVTVADTGVGIRSQDLARLFQPFSQVHDTMQLTAAGTGLGLYISRGIIEEHGGHIWCESAGLGKGTSFHFELPLLQDTTPAAPSKSSSLDPVSAATLSPTR